MNLFLQGTHLNGDDDLHLLWEILENLLLDSPQQVRAELAMQVFNLVLVRKRGKFLFQRLGIRELEEKKNKRKN